MTRALLTGAALVALASALIALGAFVVAFIRFSPERY